MNRALTFFLSLCLFCCCASSLWAQQPASDYVDFETSVRQAQTFAKKGWHREAIKEIRKALTTSQGQKSSYAYSFLSTECLLDLDVGCSFTAAQTARELAVDPTQSQSAQGRIDYLNAAYGKVEFRAGDGELTEGCLVLEPQEPILDRDVKRYYNEKVVPLATQKRTLPWVMYLPVNTYQLYGKEFTVEGGKEIVVNAGFTTDNTKTPPPVVTAAPTAPILIRQQRLTLGVQLPLVDGLSPGALLTGVLLHKGKPSMGVEMPVIAGFKLARTGVWPTLASGVAAGGQISLPKNFALRWSGGIIGGLGAFSTRCGPEAGDPATVELTCGLTEGFPAVMMSPWAGPYGQLGLTGFKLGSVRVGLGVQAFVELHPALAPRNTLNVTAAGGQSYDLPYKFADGGALRAIQPVLGPTITVGW